MEQEWMRGALLQMKGLMHTAIGDLKAVQHTLERKSLWGESDSRFAQQSNFNRQASAIARQGTQGRRQESKQSSVSSSSDEPIHTYERTNLKTFERAMTLEQLKIIDQELDRWCRGWTDAFTGAAISVATLNLYQFNYHHVLSQTAPPEGVLLQWPASLVKDMPAIGSTVFQTCPHMKLPRASGKVISAETANENGMNMLTLCVQLVQGPLHRAIDCVGSWDPWDPWDPLFCRLPFQFSLINMYGIYKSIDCVVFCMVHPNRCAQSRPSRVQIILAFGCSFACFFNLFMGNDGNVHKLGQQWTHFVTFGIHPCENSNSFDPYPDWMESQDNSEETKKKKCRVATLNYPHAR
jgi:hypothetical protein